MSKHERWGNPCHFCEEFGPCETVTLRAENARLREQANALATVVQLARNGHYWANNAEQRADPLGYLQSRVEDLADKADTALRDYLEWLKGEGQ